MVATIGSAVVLMLVAVCILNIMRCIKSPNPKFMNAHTALAFSIFQILWVGIIVAILYSAYVGNESAIWLFMIFLIMSAAGSLLVAIGYNIFRVTLFKTEIHWRNYFGKKRIYSYDDISECYLNTRNRGSAVVICMKFKDGKKVKIVATTRVFVGFEQRKIEINDENLPDFWRGMIKKSVKDYKRKARERNKKKDETQNRKNSI